ncbi:hypothetical protein GCM10010145_39450 [Streptomyces ruber]|uniref:Uncharacterized protein n=2 Tax=Streptomyces TaxID=1883 RepID=A0A918EU94_9ACTN|nr:hypothetical protein GCM10010145_39450 [Streptomyces ruber]
MWCGCGTRAGSRGEDPGGITGGEDPGGITAGAPGHSLVHAPLWCTELVPGVRVEQSYGTGNPLVSGHWRPLDDGTGGPEAAAGQAFAQAGRALLTV